MLTIIKESNNFDIADIIFDNEKFSDHNLSVSYISGSPNDTIEIGNKLNITKIKAAYADKWDMVNSTYDDSYQISIEVSKLRCENINDYKLTDKEINDVVSWLNRKYYRPLEFVYEPVDVQGLECSAFENKYFMGTFSEINLVQIGGDVVGFKLTFIANTPYALGYMETIDGSMNSTTPLSILNKSNEEGVNYCYAEITCGADGDLKITNDFDEQVILIKNCKNGELFTFGDTGTIAYMDRSIEYVTNNRMITTSLAAHKKTLMNDFNYKFPRLATNYYVFGDKNSFKSSIPTTVKLCYTPLYKVGGFTC